jgi:hypothetical protein
MTWEDQRHLQFEIWPTIACDHRLQSRGVSRERANQPQTPILVEPYLIGRSYVNFTLICGQGWASAPQLR